MPTRIVVTEAEAGHSPYVIIDKVIDHRLVDDKTSFSLLGTYDFGKRPDDFITGEDIKVVERARSTRIHLPGLKSPDAYGLSNKYESVVMVRGQNPPEPITPLPQETGIDLVLPHQARLVAVIKSDSIKAPFLTRIDILRS